MLRKTVTFAAMAAALSAGAATAATHEVNIFDNDLMPPVVYAAPGDTVRFAGAVIVRQRPGTAKGMLFLTLEDETGMAQAILTPDLLDEHRDTIVGSAGLVIEGPLQDRDGSRSVRAQKLWRIDRLVPTPSHDWH